MSEQAENTQERLQIKISDVLNMLKEGKTRVDIAEHYGITKADCKRLFLHDALKGKKTIKAKVLPFEIVDDSQEDIQEVAHQGPINDNEDNVGPGNQTQEEE